MTESDEYESVEAIAHLLCEVLRAFLRTVAGDERTRRTATLSFALARFLASTSNAHPDARIQDICVKVIETFSRGKPRLEEDFLVIAKIALQLFAEQSCTDNAAQGRASKLEHRLHRAVVAASEEWR